MIAKKRPAPGGSLSYCCTESGVSEAFLPHVAVTDALKQVWIATRAGVAAARGATELVEPDAAWSQGGAVAVESVDSLAEGDTAVEQDEAEAGPVWSVVQAEPACSEAGWGAPEAGPVDFPVELGAFEAV